MLDILEISPSLSWSPVANGYGPRSKEKSASVLVQRGIESQSMHMNVSIALKSSPLITEQTLTRWITI